MVRCTSFPAGEMIVCSHAMMRCAVQGAHTAHAWEAVRFVGFPFDEVPTGSMDIPMS